METNTTVSIKTNTFFIISGVGLSPLGTAATSGLLYKPQMIDEGDCGAIGGMKIGRGNRSTRRKPAPAPLCPPQIPHDQTRECITYEWKPLLWSLLIFRYWPLMF
jgi:hypothetical protein